MTAEYVIVLTTLPGDFDCRGFGRTLVEERLAACVSRLPGMQSTYRWQGAVERAEEVLLLIKTTAGRQDALIARLQALHPYELPEAIAVEIRGGLAPYLDWVAEQTREDD